MNNASMSLHVRVERINAARYGVFVNDVHVGYVRRYEKMRTTSNYSEVEHPFIEWRFRSSQEVSSRFVCRHHTDDTYAAENVEATIFAKIMPVAISAYMRRYGGKNQVEHWGYASGESPMPKWDQETSLHELMDREATYA